MRGCDVVWRVDHLDKTPDDGALDTHSVDAFRTGPFAHYTMEEVDAANRVVDVAGGYDASCLSCPMLAVGKVEGALAFNTINATNRLEIEPAPPFSHLTEFSVAGWLEMTSLTDVACPWGKPYGGGNASSWQLCTANGQLEFITESTDGSSLVSGDVFHADALWHHVAIVFDGTTKSIWFDGAPVGNAPASPPAIDDHRVEIGGDVDTISGAPMTRAPFQGALDDLQFFSYALGPDEIQHLFKP